VPRKALYPFLALTVALPLMLAYLLIPQTVESHDVGRRTKFLVGLESTASYAADWYCSVWYPSLDPNGGWHPQGANYGPPCSGGNTAFSSLDWQVPAETRVILNAWSSDPWGADQHEHYKPEFGIHCTGIDVVPWDPNIWQELGRIHYVHVWRASYEWDLGVRPAGDTDIYLGNVEDWQPDDCPRYPPGGGWPAHLHQSGERGAEHTWTGWGIPVTADPNNTNHYLHEARW